MMELNGFSTGWLSFAVDFGKDNVQLYCCTSYIEKRKITHQKVWFKSGGFMRVPVPVVGTCEQIGSHPLAACHLSTMFHSHSDVFFDCIWNAHGHLLGSGPFRNSCQKKTKGLIIQSLWSGLIKFQLKLMGWAWAIFRQCCCPKMRFQIQPMVPSRWFASLTLAQQINEHLSVGLYRIFTCNRVGLQRCGVLHAKKRRRLVTLVILS